MSLRPTEDTNMLVDAFDSDSNAESAKGRGAPRTVSGFSPLSAPSPLSASSAFKALRALSSRLVLSALSASSALSAVNAFSPPRKRPPNTRTRSRRPFAAALLAFLVSAFLIRPAAAAGTEPRPTLAIAAASNFIHALDALHAEFARTAPDVALRVATGASGTLFAQIQHGAPFDVFLSADTDYPARAVAAGIADAATLRTFATGRLVLWTTRTDLDLADPAAALRSPDVKKIAIAHPETAPYGRAAEAALRHLGVWTAVQSKIVHGENITQTAQFVATRNADAGFVALSLVLSPRLAHRGRWHEIPASHHAEVSLDHAVVLTRRGAGNPAARRYLDFLASPAAKKILRTFGYRVPGPEVVKAKL